MIARQDGENLVRAKTLIALSLLAGLTTGGCAASLSGTSLTGTSVSASGEQGGTIRESQLQIGTSEDVAAVAGRYCRQYGRSAHITHETVWPFWQDFSFDCVGA